MYGMEKANYGNFLRGLQKVPTTSLNICKPTKIDNNKAK